MTLPGASLRTIVVPSAASRRLLPERGLCAGAPGRLNSLVADAAPAQRSGGQIDLFVSEAAASPRGRCLRVSTRSPFVHMHGPNLRPVVRIALAGSVAFAFVALLCTAAEPSKAKVHGFTLSGTVASVDEAKKTLVVRNAAGRRTTLVWTGATSVFGGKLAAGQLVTLRYLDKDGKHIATSIRIGPPSATPSAAATPAPTATAASR